jgi:hypothetical protein
MEPVDAGLRLTALMLLLHPIGDWYLRPVILAIAFIVLLVPNQLRNPMLWGALAALVTLRLVLAWPAADNHAYLLAYWCLAVFIAVGAEDTDATLELNARLMIGLVFALATVWKLLSPDYANGVFFRVAMATDPRFEGFSLLIGGLSVQELFDLRAFLHEHNDGGAISQLINPGEPARYVWIAKLTAWWNIAIDAAIAIAFLSPTARGLSRTRDGLLLLFCVTTYAVATVEGFAWLLIAMAVTRCRSGSRTVPLYVVTFLMILFYREIPWAEEIFYPFIE